MADAHSKPVWFITGCSTGFGRELCAILLKRGYRVVVTARDKAKVDDIVAGHDKNGLALKLDVDKQDQIDAAVKAAEAQFGRIEVLVNNAGYGYLAAVEEGDDADVRAMFDTNFFGLAATTRAVLPIMRAQKSGAIVNISSMGGFIGFPGSGYYAATKFAVEGLSEALSKEVAPFGIKVVIVEPGPFRTDWAGRSLKTLKKPVDAYAETAIGRRRQVQSYSGNQPGDPVRASEAIITTVEQQHSPLRLASWRRRLRSDRGRDRSRAQAARFGGGGGARRGLSKGGLSAASGKRWKSAARERPLCPVRSEEARMTDTFSLERFVDAQAGVYPQVCRELQAGRKESHWMWFIFPQIVGLGQSPMSIRFAIASLDEAKAYLAHLLLGPRLRECARLALEVEGRSARDIFGSIDEMKFRSSITLFGCAASDEDVFQRCLDKYFAGAPDPTTLARL
jgi:NAD(P)-dependent dehydrogenase (short-subunit alcohol dehydrogenase family)/uncharacterized protein (DUF1810 family)